ncbi:MAG: efflux RND transporter permease subunit [Moraxellaceae bacterium]|nr:efflux RND transporter permease subunit [Moraxellaceae bacterium]
MNISTWSIRNPVPVILLFILMTLAGLGAFAALKIQNFPDIDVPLVTISVSLPGASPSQLESEVARRIENSLATLQGIKHIRSTLSDGQASISAEFRLEKPVQEAVDDVRDAVARVRGDLPAALRDPVIRKAEIADSPILTYTVASTRMDDEALSWFVDDEVTRRLLAVRGAGAVSRVGGAQRELRVDLDPQRLLALRITAAEVSRQLAEVQQEASGGRVTLGSEEQSVRMLATSRSAEEVGAIELALDDGRRVRLDQIASVRDTVAERRSAAFLDGQPVVAFEVVRARGYGEVEVAAGVREALAKLEQERPDITVTEAFNFVDPVVENYDSSMLLLYEGAALAVLVVFLFLRNGRATLLAAVALPLSVIPTFALMYWMGFSLNIVTLLSLSLVVGVLVDDAIVEIENIQRHLLMGKSPLRAARDAATEIGLAVIATTFTLIAVFLPTAFMGGIVGKYFVQFGWTAACAVFFSLVVARMLTPMMAAWLLRAPTRPHRDEPAWMKRYLGWAQWCLRHRGRSTAAVAVFLAGGIVLSMLLPATFIPVDDDDKSQVTLNLPPGSQLADTIALAEQARALLRQNPHVKMVYTAIGGGNTGADPNDAGGGAVSDVGKAVLTLTLTHRRQRIGLLKHEIEQQLRESLDVLPGARVKVGMGGSSEGYEFALSGQDGHALEQHARRVEQALRGIEGVGAVTSTASIPRPELVIRPDFARAADLGVTSAAIAETLRVASQGDYEQDLAKLSLNERQVPIMVRLEDSARHDIDTLRRLPVPGKHGPVALEDVASLEIASGPSQIVRLNRMRTVEFEVQLQGQALGDVEQAIEALPALKHLPAGIVQTELGEAEEMQQLVTGFGIAMLTGVLCIYMVLVLLLKGFMQPATILTALLLSVPGAILALFITGSALSMPSMIGMIMLMGVATKNSILLVDYIIIARHEHGLPRTEAILDACRKRARPIVMTTIAMGAGMLPTALGLGGDPSFRAPMAIVVIGGLITSTVLSLLVIPVIYSYVDDLVQWSRRAVGHGSADPETA